MNDAQIDRYRQEICVIGRRLYDRGYISGSEGNISQRVGDGWFLCTPTRVSKGFLASDQVSLIDPTGKLLAGPLNPTSEHPMHLAIYAAQPAARAVIHAHPPYATALGVAGIPLPCGMLAEGVVFLGDVPLLPYETPGTTVLASQVAGACDRHQAIMMKNHGAIVWADDLEQAWMLMETIEAVAKVTWLARTLGRLDLIPADKLAELPRPTAPVGWAICPPVCLHDRA